MRTWGSKSKPLTGAQFARLVVAEGASVEHLPGGGLRIGALAPGQPVSVFEAVRKLRPRVASRAVRPTRAGRTTVIGRGRSSRCRGRARARAPDDPDLDAGDPPGDPDVDVVLGLVLGLHDVEGRR
jgi:hypothetical protein